MDFPELHYIDMRNATGVWQIAAPGSPEWARLIGLVNLKLRGEQTIVTDEWIVRWAPAVKSGAAA